MTIFAHTPHSQIETGSTPVVYRAPAGDLAIVIFYAEGVGISVEAYPVLAYRHDPDCFPMMPICAEADFTAPDINRIALCCGGGIEVTDVETGKRHANVEAWMAATVVDFDPAVDMARLPPLYAARLV